MMTNLFLHILLPMCLAGSVFYSFTILLRLLARRFGRVRRLISIAALLVFLIPLPYFAQSGIAALSNTSNQQINETLRTMPGAAPVYQAGNILGSAVAAPQEAREGSALLPATKSANTPISFATAIALIYTIGLCGSLAISTLRYGLFRRRLKRSCTLISDGFEAKTLTILCAQMQIKRPPPIYCSSYISTPILVGAIRPCIILPDSRENTTASIFALRHELTHLKHRDIWLKFLSLLAVAVHWYNPLVYLLQRDVSAACEIYCDQSIALSLDRQGKNQYAASLLAYAAMPLPFAVSGFASPAKKLKQRFVNLFAAARFSRRRTAIATSAICCLLLLSLLAGCSLAAGTSSQQPSPALPKIDTPSQPPPAPSQSIAPESKAPSTASTSSKPESSSITKASTIGKPGSSSIPASSSGEASSPFATELVWPVSDYTFISRGIAESHRGTDIIASKGVPILAVAAGTVIEAEFTYSFGNYTQIDHGNGVSTLYAHCDTLKVNVGDVVEAGQEIATIGSTGNSSGNHLHLEMEIDDKLVDIMDYMDEPAKYHFGT